ncbi:MAG: hypothetical protein QW478_15375 [Candidatus Micrarchaeaceae archaeon]
MRKLAKNNNALSLTKIFISPLFAVTTIVGIIVYWYLFNYIDAHSFFMLTASIYLIYTLVITSALLLATGVYSMKQLLTKSRGTASVSAAPASAATSIFGSMFSCGCHFSLLASFLATVGLSTGEVGAIESFDLFYSNYVVAFFILINIGLFYYVIRKIRASM